jgi:nucleotide-binding universal stress UspA family protein
MSGESAEGGYLGGHEEGPDADDIDDRLTEHVAELMGVSTESSDGIDVVTAVATGTPHTEILEYADEHDVDLVVMGTHGRTGVERHLLGSVTEKVVRMADAPVVTVRADEEE